MMTVGTLSKSCSRIAGPMSTGAAESVSAGCRGGFDTIRASRRCPACACVRHVSSSPASADQPIVGSDEVLLLRFLAEFLAGRFDLLREHFQLGTEMVGDDAGIVNANGSFERSD